MYDAKDILRLFAGDGPCCADAGDAGGNMGEGFLSGGVWDEALLRDREERKLRGSGG